MLVLYMAGPNTNWSVMENIKAHRYKNKLPQIGSCGLRVVNGTLQTGVKGTGWKLNRFLKALWKLCNDSPARQDLYINLNRSDKFSLKFCHTRWVRDESIGCQAITIWQFVVNVVNHCQSLSKWKHLKNKSHDLLVKYVSDNLMFLKFQFFKNKIPRRCSNHAFSVRCIRKKFTWAYENVLMCSCCWWSNHTIQVDQAWFFFPYQLIQFTL